MILPLLCSSSGRKALQPLTTPIRLIAICQSQSSRDNSLKKPPEATPALLTMTSMPPSLTSQAWANAVSWL
ncbi:hypothetical protein D3C84_1075190 [compost metagenome]